MQRILLFTVGSVCSVKRFTAGSRNSQGRSKVSDDARPGRPVGIVTEASVQRVEELIRADKRITIDRVATALGRSHGLVYNIMHDLLKFRKVCAPWVPRELKDREKVSITYSMQMKEKICLTGLLLGSNHECFTTNPNQNMLKCNGNIPVHLHVTSSAAKALHTAFCDSQGMLLDHFQKRGKM
jgi:hypothetical protein